MTNSKAFIQEIPQEWIEAYLKLRELDRPKKLAPETWLRIQYNAMVLYKNDIDILKAMIVSNWSLLDIFGCHYSAPTKRFDCKGLLIAKHQKDRIVEVTEESIKLKKRNGIIQGLYKPLGNLPERVLLYELS